jgi:hypothetical protein
MVGQVGSEGGSTVSVVPVDASLSSSEVVVVDSACSLASVSCSGNSEMVTVDLADTLLVVTVDLACTCSLLAVVAVDPVAETVDGGLEAVDFLLMKIPGGPEAEKCG